MTRRDPIKMLLALVALLAIAGTIGAVVADVSPSPQPSSVAPRTRHMAPPRTVVRNPRPSAQVSDDGEVDITAYVNLYAIAGVVTCFGLLASWGWWQTHHRCPVCGYCPAWCHCGQATHRRSH